MADLSKLPHASINAWAKSTGDKSAKSRVDVKTKINKKNKNVKSWVSAVGTDVVESHQDSTGKKVFNYADITSGEGSFISQIARAEDLGVNMLTAKTNGSDIYQKGDLNYAKITGNDNIYESDTDGKGVNILELEGKNNTANTDGNTIAVVDGKNNTLNTGEGDDLVFINSGSATVTDSSDQDNDIAIISDNARSSKVEGYEYVYSEDGKELVWDEKQGKYVENNQSSAKKESTSATKESTSTTDAPTFAFIGFTSNTEETKPENTEPSMLAFIGVTNDKSNECSCEESKSPSNLLEQLFSMIICLFSFFNFLDA